MKYPFLQLSKVNSRYADELKTAANRVIESGWYLNGNENKAFEQELALKCNSKYAVATSNGLDALRLIFRAYMELGKLSPGDEVIVQANTYIASILSISDNGLTPILVEPCETTFNLDSSLIEDSITSRTKAILVVHLYGTPCWDEKIKDIAQRYNLLVIEDNAQSIGASSDTTGINGHYTTGSLGDAAAFSFYPTKNIGALGDSGAITSSDEELIKTVRALANYGSDRRYHNIYKGLNCRMDEIQAAFLRVKLQHLDSESKHRNEIAKTYDACITNPLITKPLIFDSMTQVWHQYVIRCTHRSALCKYLEENGVGTDIHYATPPHLQPCYKDFFKGNYPITEQLANEVISLPIASIDNDAAKEIAQIINSFKV